MPYQGWTETLSVAQTAGASLASFTTAVSMLPTPARHTLSPDFWEIGRALRITAAGYVGNVVTAQPTFTVDVRFGTIAVPIIVFNMGAMLTSTTAHTTLPWMLDLIMTCRSIGSGTAATMIGQGTMTGRAFIDLGATADITTLGHPSLVVPETVPTVGTGFDSNNPQTVDLFVTCSVSNAANTWRCEQYHLQSLN
jgi:hypothetical protein